MTRKDYVLLAEAIASAYAAIPAPENPHETNGVRRVASHVADALARDNPRFDRERFLKAAGVAP